MKNINMQHKQLFSDKTTAFGETVNLSYQKIKPPANANNNYYIDNSQLYLYIPQVAGFHVLANQNLIIIDRYNDEVADSAIANYLFGSIFAYLLQYRGLLVLHGSSVLVNGKAVVFSGDSGAGKSTLAAAMLSRGYPLITDDVVVVRTNRLSKQVIEPGSKKVKLWDSALDYLKISKNGLKHIENKLNKFEVPVTNACDAHDGLAEIAVLYDLVPNDSCDEISLYHQHSVDKIKSLLKNTYRYNMLKPLNKLQLHFEQLSKLASQIEVIKVERPSARYMLAELVDKLTTDFASL